MKSWRRRSGSLSAPCEEDPAIAGREKTIAEARNAKLEEKTMKENIKEVLEKVAVFGLSPVLIPVNLLVTAKNRKYIKI